MSILSQKPIMSTAKIMHFIKRKMSNIFQFLCEINQGLVWKIVSEKYFHGKKNNLVSEYSR